MIKAINDKLILLLYCIPYFYISMWLDITYKIVWPYIVVAALLLTMRIALGTIGKGKIAFKGFCITMISTFLCIMTFQWSNLNKWQSYFGPFFPFPLIVAVIVAEMFIDALKENK